MQPVETNLANSLLPHGPAIVTFAGGGGKTSLLFALANALAATGAPVLCTTTTKMLRPEPTEWLGVDVRPDAGVESLPDHGALFAAFPPPDGVDSRKVIGFAPETIDAMRAKRPDAWIVVEADGAAGRPLKAPAEHEPVIPSLTSVAIAVIGLDCVGQAFSPDMVFRADRVAAISGLKPGEPMTPEAIARLVPHPDGMFKNVPPGARRLLFCNKSDLSGAAGAGEALALAVRKCRTGFLDGMFVGSVMTKGLRCLSYPAN